MFGTCPSDKWAMHVVSATRSLNSHNLEWRILNYTHTNLAVTTTQCHTAVKLWHKTMYTVTTLRTVRMNSMKTWTKNWVCSHLLNPTSAKMPTADLDSVCVVHSWQGERSCCKYKVTITMFRCHLTLQITSLVMQDEPGRELCNSCSGLSIQ